MTHHLAPAFRDDIITHAELQGRLRRNRATRTFDLHPLLFAGTIGCYFAFLGIMAASFMNANLAIPFVIFVAYIVMAFATPAMWARIAPRQGGRLQEWADFLREGIETGSGHLGGGAAVAQVMVLPALIVGWALAIAVIHATV